MTKVGTKKETKKEKVPPSWSMGYNSTLSKGTGIEQVMKRTKGTKKETKKEPRKKLERN